MNKKKMRSDLLRKIANTIDMLDLAYEFEDKYTDEELDAMEDMKDKILEQFIKRYNIF